MTAQTVYLQIQGIFLFSLVWSLGSCLPTESRIKFDAFFRDLVSGINQDHPKPKSIKITKTNSIPERHTVYDFWFDKRSIGSWTEWSNLDQTLNSFNHLDSNDKIVNNLDNNENKVNVQDSIIVQTAETAKMYYFFNLYERHKKPMLIVGPTGRQFI